MPTTATSRRLHEVAGPVILSGYASELYDGLFGDWHQVQLSPWSDNALKRDVVEVVWANRTLGNYR